MAFSPVIKNPIFNNVKLRKDPLLSSMLNRPFLPTSNEGKIGGYPAKLLEKMVLVTKILGVKKSKIKLLRNMNSLAEKMFSFEEDIPEEFERKYAGVLIDVEKLNTDLHMYLDEMQVRKC